VPIDRDFTQALIEALAKTQWTLTTFDDSYPNPMPLTFAREGETLRLLVHARRLTHQGEKHHRPSGEYHAQMIFDGDTRGAGIRNTLRFREDYLTLLIGFYAIADTYIVVAYNPARHATYAYSASLQIKEDKFNQALRQGITLHYRQGNDESVVAFRLEYVAAYLQQADAYHRLNDEDFVSTEVTSSLRQVLVPDVAALPELVASERQHLVREVNQYVRDRNFAHGIRAVYPHCAICNFQYDAILDAAHIVPVAEGGTDTYDNGLGLCPTCHRMYDKGQILVDEKGVISLNRHLAEHYQQHNQANSLTELQSRLRSQLWLPNDPKFRPAPHNLRTVFHQRRRWGAS
jgi:hypothetical protein